jgi:hypothetical protein
MYHGSKMNRKVGAESGRLGIDVRPASNCIDQIDWQVVNRQLFFETVSSDVQFLAKLSTALMPQLQFWHLYSPLVTCTVPYVLRVACYGDDYVIA